jgi:hypothetical protein
MLLYNRLHYININQSIKFNSRFTIKDSFGGDLNATLISTHCPTQALYKNKSSSQERDRIRFHDKNLGNQSDKVENL